MSRSAEFWRGLSPRSRTALIVAGVAEGVLKVFALRDLRHRPAAEVRGPKPLWSTAIVLVNGFGIAPAAYLLLGRRR